MLKFLGKSVLDGVAEGLLCVPQEEEPIWDTTARGTAEEEILRFHRARELAVKYMVELQEETLQKAGREAAAIFEAYCVLLEDPGLVGCTEELIRREGVSAWEAVERAGNDQAHRLAAMEDVYLRERAEDVRQVARCVIRQLQEEARGYGFRTADLPGGCILVAKDLSAEEMVQLNSEQVRGVVLQKGSVYSHVAILARAMGIPMLMGTSIDGKLRELDQKPAVLDGFSGILYVEPSEGVRQELEKKGYREDDQRGLEKLTGKSVIAPDGRELRICANISTLTELERAVQKDVAGIGLFRSEFMFLSRKIAPTEEEQFQIYKKVAETMAPKKVVIRTLDAGGDKQLPWLGGNPAWDYRGIRVGLAQPEVLWTQLRAIYRAAAYGQVAVMYPMIISLEEVHQAKALAHEARRQLLEEGMDCPEILQGIMIETPAAALISDQLAQEVDFFSIGTNDLTQYTLAVDRQSPELGHLYDSHHPAVLQLIELTAKNARKAGIPVSICGELGADTSLTEAFLQMGIEEVSVAPDRIPEVRREK